MHGQALGDHVSLLSQAQGSYTPVPGSAAHGQLHFDVKETEAQGRAKFGIGLAHSFPPQSRRNLEQPPPPLPLEGWPRLALSLTSGPTLGKP